MISPAPTDTAEQAPWSARDTAIGAGFTLVPLIAFSVLNQLASGPIQKLTPTQDTINAIIIFIFDAVIEGVFLIAPILYARRRGGSAWLQDLGLRTFHPALALGLIILGIAATLIAGNIYDAIAHALHAQPQTNLDLLTKQIAAAPRTVFAVLISAVVIAPICEEVFFRGFLLPGLRHVMSAPWAIVVSSVIFAIAHVQLGSLPLLIVLALFLGILRVTTRSIWPGVILHTLNNALGLISVIVLLNQK